MLMMLVPRTLRRVKKQKLKHDLSSGSPVGPLDWGLSGAPLDLRVRQPGYQFLVTHTASPQLTLSLRMHECIVSPPVITGHRHV